MYSLALAAYALQLANHNSRSYILQSLDSRALRKGERTALSRRWVMSNDNS